MNIEKIITLTTGFWFLVIGTLPFLGSIVLRYSKNVNLNPISSLAGIGSWYYNALIILMLPVFLIHLTISIVFFKQKKYSGSIGLLWSIIVLILYFWTKDLSNNLSLITYLGVSIALSLSTLLIMRNNNLDK